MKKYKIILIISIVAILLSLSAVNAVDLNDDVFDGSNQDSNILLNEDSQDSNILLNENHLDNDEESAIDGNYENNEDISNNSNNLNANNPLESTSQLYVDINNGDDSNDGKSLENPLKSFEKALNLSENNCTIHLANGDYIGLKNTGITINKSLTIIGDENTTFNGLNENYIFIIDDNLTINLKNINFINGYKDSSNSNSNKVYGGALEIKKSYVNIYDCKFINNVLDYDCDEEYKYGGAISNLGDLTIVNSHFYNNSIISTNRIVCYGGAIYNKGNLTIENSSFIESKGDKYTYGGTIYNDGNGNMENSIIADSYSKEESRGSAIYNKGNFTLRNSIIENNTIERLNFNYIEGSIFNSGSFIAIGNIFRNNTGYYKQPNSEYEGSPTIYSVGDLELEYNIFLNNTPFNRIAPDLYISGGKNINIDNNFWGTNNNPFDENKINLDLANRWIVLEISPEYSNIDINHPLEFIASLKSSHDESLEISLLPNINISFYADDEFICEKELANGIATVNHTFGEKGRYEISGSIHNLTKTLVVDVGKKESYMEFNVSENINYTEDLKINLTVFDEDSNLSGNVSILLNDEKYTVNLIDGRGNLTLSNLMPDNYTLRLIYEGDENHSKAFGERNFTINKTQINLSIEVDDITVGETGNAIITLDSRAIPGEVRLYVNNQYKGTVNLYNETTDLSLNDFSRGEYLITVEFMGTSYYETANASALFKVKGLDGAISVSCEDIKIGNNATVIIKSDVDDLTGNAILIINGEEYGIYIGNKTTNITLADLTNGTYEIKVIYNGNDKYSPSNASCSFDVSKYSSNLIVDIIANEEDIDGDTFTGNIIVRTEPNNCTGPVNLFVNIRQYTLNLSDGRCNFSVEFDKGTNYIFIFYEGDYFFEAENWNTTYGMEDEFYIIASDVTSYEHNDFNYTVLLVEKSGITMPNRIVNLSFDGANYTLITDNNGKAYLPLNLNVGEYSINASYKNMTVTNKITIKPMEFDLIACNISYGENKSIEVIFNISDGNSGNDSEDLESYPSINGKVHFKIIDIDKGIEIADEEVIIKDNKASYDISQLNVGNYTVSANFANDAFNSSSKNARFNIEKANAKLGIGCNDINFGEDAIINVSLPNAVGNIQFNVNESIYNVEIHDSCAVLNLTNLAPGTYDVSIAFNGDSNYYPCEGNASFSVRNSTTSLNIQVNNTEYGKDIMVIARLNEDAQGNVTFKINGMAKICEIHDGTASCIFNDLEVSNYHIEAIYSGDKKYIPKSNSTSFEVYTANSFINLYAEEPCLNENIRIFANLSKNATGTVTFSIEGYYSPREKNIKDSSASWYISPLDEGTYTVIATYNGDKNYLSSSTTYQLNVSKIRAKLNVEIRDRNVNDTISITAKLISANNENISGNISVEIDGKSYRMAIQNGEGFLNIGKLEIGNYSFSAIYEGSQKYSKAISDGKFKVIDNLLNAKLEFKDFVEYYKASKQVVIKLLDGNNKPISGEVIYIRINNKAYKCITDSKGNAKLPINLKPGNNTGEIIFNESKTYHKLYDTVKITVLKTVQSNDLTKKYNASGQYIAIFYNSNGKALGNAKVQVIIGKAKYNFTTLPNGVLRLNINLKPGKYTIKAINPVTGEVAKNTIFIFQYIMENRNLIKYYKGSEDYKVRAYGNNGKAVGSGKIVAFRINGKTYNRKTNKNGYASLKINFSPKTYTITATYNKFKVSNKITVKPVLTAKNRSYKKGKTVKFYAKLVNTKGKPLKAKKIDFKIKNKKYSAKTNSNGVATVTIKIALKVGSHKIQSTYGSSKITNTIKISK